MFRISTDCGDQYLCTREKSDIFSVVEVKADYFLEMWRNDTAYESHCGVSHGSPETWVNDYKFKDAEKGFSYGELNPVPLAHVSCEIYNEVKDVWKRRYFFFRGSVKRTVSFQKIMVDHSSRTGTLSSPKTI